MPLAKCSMAVVFLALCAVLALAMPANAVKTCGHVTVSCWGSPHPDTGQLTLCGKVNVDACWSWKEIDCVPCSRENDSVKFCGARTLCNLIAPSCCAATPNGQCSLYWHGIATWNACPSGFTPPN